METVKFSATFSVPPSETPEGFVLRPGKIFEIGDYPDKAFSLTEAEADAAIAAFKPVFTDVEHVPSVFDKKLGELRRVWREGKDIFGEYAEPSWLSNVLGDTPRKVSATWDRVSKTLAGIALVEHPRIPDAVLYSAFSEFAGKRHSAQDLADLQTIHDLVTKQGATCAVTYSEQPPGTGTSRAGTREKEPKPMNLWEQLQAALTGQKPIETTEVQPITPPAKPAGFSIGDVTFSDDQIKSAFGEAKAYRDSLVADLKKAHLRCFGKEMDEPKVVTFAAQSVEDIKAMTATYNETADAKFGIGKGPDGGAVRQTAPAAFAVSTEATNESENLEKIRKEARSAYERRTGKILNGTRSN